MSTTALCDVCEGSEADFQCDRCGALVCETHYDVDTGLCTDCAGESGGRRL